MKSCKKITAFLLAALAALALAPQSGLALIGDYGGVGYAPLDIEYTDTRSDGDIDVLIYHRGKHLGEVFSVDVRFGIGEIKGDDDMDSSLEENLEDIFGDVPDLWGFLGMYLRAGIDLWRFRPYLIGGVAYFSDTKGSFDDIPYGAGLDLRLFETVSVSAEYMNHYDTEHSTVSGYTFGFNRHDQRKREEVFYHMGLSAKPSATGTDYTLNFIKYF